MNFLNYSLTALVSYIGLFLGFALALIAKEEIKPGKKNLIFLQKIILLLIFGFLLILFEQMYLSILVLLMFISLSLWKKYSKKEFNELPYIYILFGMVFYLSSKRLNLFVIESSLIFLYGLPVGSLLTTKNKKETVVKLLSNIGFVLVAVVLFLIF